MVIRPVFTSVVVGGVALLTATAAFAQGAANAPELVAGIPVNYDEEQVGEYTLPDPLVMLNGERVRDAETWYNKRRPELVALFEEHQYGKTPPVPEDLWFDVTEQAGTAFDGRAIRRQVTVHFTRDPEGPQMDVLMYIPANAAGPAPMLLNISFFPNSSTVADTMVHLGSTWSAQTRERVQSTRRAAQNPAYLERLLSEGFAWGTIYYGDIDPDFANAATLGVRSLWLAPGETEPAPDEWGAISAWAWGLSRALDYLQTDPDIDHTRVAITGASRLGKTVLWAGARDPRFAMVIASVSGAGGAALERRNYGETIAHLVADGRYPYQFARNWQRYAEDPNLSPVDSHMLISLVAPRPLLLQTGTTDFWSDPRGEFLAAVASEPVWELLGAKGLGTDVLPEPDQPILNDLGYLMHEGGHGTLPRDWDVFIDFMKLHFLD
ncbi:MAG TPA: hypothetical protein VNZ57_10030 [Longimicrobiales bacterium]|nr:hypothetical protein [Longimicrobiales bacterium]